MKMLSDKVILFHPHSYRLCALLLTKLKPHEKDTENTTCDSCSKQTSKPLKSLPLVQSTNVNCIFKHFSPSERKEMKEKVKKFQLSECAKISECSKIYIYFSWNCGKVRSDVKFSRCSLDVAMNLDGFFFGFSEMFRPPQILYQVSPPTSNWAFSDPNVKSVDVEPVSNRDNM